MRPYSIEICAGRLAFAILVWACAISGSAAERAAREIMRHVEDNQRISAEIVSFEMILTDKSAFQRRRTVREFRRREPSGLESALVFFDEPPDIRGSALLSKERRDGWDDQWLYLPAVGKIRRIAESGRTDYFLGTDLTFEDFSVEDVDRYAYRFAGPDTFVDGRRTHAIDAEPSDSAAFRRSGYRLRRVYVDAERFVILKTEYFGRDAKLLKILTAAAVAPYGSAWRADSIFVENFARRHSTRITVSGRNIQLDLPAEVFTARTLQRGVAPQMPARQTRTSP